MDFGTLIQDPDMFMLGIREQRKALMKGHFAKRHYVAIAKVIANLDIGSYEHNEVMNGFITLLANDNNKFDEGKFRDACNDTPERIIRDIR